jgi:hypothetical protein
MQITITTLALLSTLASAAPTTKVARGTGKTFNLVLTSVERAPEDLAKLQTGKWFVGSRNLRAELVPEFDQANLFYKYSPEDKVGTASTGMVITPGGTATISSGKPVELVNNNGTAGVDILQNASGLPALSYANGRFQACVDGEGIFLSHIAAGQRQLVDCASVELIAVCSSTGLGSPLTGQLGQPVIVDCQSN